MLLVAWDCNQVERNGKREVLCVDLVLGKRDILCVSLNPADVFLGLYSVPLHLLLLIKDFVQHSWRLVVVCPPPPSVNYLLCKEGSAVSHDSQTWSTAIFRWSSLN